MEIMLSRFLNRFYDDYDFDYSDYDYLYDRFNRYNRHVNQLLSSFDKAFNQSLNDPSFDKACKTSGFSYRAESKDGKVHEFYKDIATGETKEREIELTKNFKPIYREQLELKSNENKQKAIEQEKKEQEDRLRLIHERDNHTRSIKQNLSHSRNVLDRYEHGVASLDELREELKRQQKENEDLLKRLEDLH